PALGKATIQGGISLSTWNVRGKIGTVSVTGGVDNWTLSKQGNTTLIGVAGEVSQSTIRSTGQIGTLRASGWVDNQMEAVSLGTWTVRRNTAQVQAGDVRNSFTTITGFLDPVRMALRTFSASGAVVNST